MKQKLLCLCLLSIFLFISMNANAYNKETFDKYFKLMPQPQKIEFLSGKGILYSTLQTVLLKGTSVKPVLYGALQSLPYSAQEGPGVLVLHLSPGKNSTGSPEG